MKSISVAAALVVVFFLSLLFINSEQSQAVPRVERVFQGLGTFDAPVDLQAPNDQSNLLYLVEKAGVVKVFTNVSTVSAQQTFLDIQDRVLSSGGEQGLLGLAFHPEFKDNGFFFVNYTAKPDGATVVSRFTSSAGLVDLNSELILLRIVQPFGNHNGGQVSFGPDGFLYIATGDGGSAGDPKNNAQNKKSLLGKILRIDVNSQSAGRNYAIPSSNPFVGKRSFSPEIYAWGLRNPWRFSFDSVTKKLWTGDVGQNTQEEINIIVKGGNYGWRFYEGNLKFQCNNDLCLKGKFVKPVHTYGRKQGVSVTGGFVYRGTAIPELYGQYVFADFESGKIFTLKKRKRVYRASLLIDTNALISSFGVDQNQELYFLDYRTGAINKLVNDPSS